MKLSLYIAIAICSSSLAIHAIPPTENSEHWLTKLDKEAEKIVSEKKDTTIQNLEEPKK